VIQQLIQNPNLRVFITNERLDNSKSFLREIKTHLEKNNHFRYLFGDLVNDDSKWTETQIILKSRNKILKEPSIQVGSLDTSLVSQHYDIIIADDLVSRNNVNTKEQIDKVKQYWKDLQSLLEPGGILLDIGTRWAMDDLHGFLLGNKDYSRIVVGCYNNGESVFPEKFTKESLQAIEKEIGSYDFSCLWKNDPIDDQSAAFKRSFFENRYEDKDLNKRLLNTFITADNAPSTKQGTDYTGIIVNSVDLDNNWYVRLALRFKGDTPALVQKIIELYLYWKPVQIGVEQKAFDDLIRPFLKSEMERRNIFFTVVELKDKGQRKEDRIRGRLQPRFENKKIWLKKDPTDNTEDLIDELIRFPRSQYDDLSDALQYQDDIAYKPNNYSREIIEEEKPLYPSIGI
jgi:phage terminase large subunit-like protein